MSKKKPMTSEDYVKKGGICCPRCGSEDITGDSVEIDAGTAWQEVTCANCDFEWQDVYTLSHYTPLN